MSRAEPCPVPGCIEFKARGSILCRRHWRSLNPITRRIINGLWRHLTTAKHSSDEASFRGIARNFIEWRRAAVSQLCEKENIHVIDN